MKFKFNNSEYYPCTQKKCGKMGRYCHEDNPEELFCFDHKQADQINMTDKLCQFHDQCIKYAHFGYEKDVACISDKSKDMKRLSTQKEKPDKCIYEGCNRCPTYNYKVYNSGWFCKDHKLDNMINLDKPRCKFENCREPARYNIKGKNSGIHCEIHKTKEMINVYIKRCQKCDNPARFNVAGKPKEFCGKHKSDGMVCYQHKKCQWPEGCNIIATYGYANQRCLACVRHKAIDMIYQTTCHVADCDTQPNYNFETEKCGKYCDKHKLIGMIDVHNRRRLCKTLLCETTGTKERDGYCLRCYIHLNPDKPVYRNWKTKELAVTDFIKKEFPDLTWITDKRIADGCTLRRPDVFLHLGEFVLIIEVDENAHRNYSEICEHRRMMELYTDVDKYNLVFIRFNPDSYVNKNNEKIPSCWILNNNDILYISDKKEWNHRLEKLKSMVKYYRNLDNKPDKAITTVELFFDEGTNPSKDKTKIKKEKALRQCVIEGCTTRPSFNFKGLTARYCAKDNHKQPGMIDVRHELCITYNCNKRALFGKTKTLPNRWCKSCFDKIQ